jgi:DNA replication protein DnaD
MNKALNLLSQSIDNLVKYHISNLPQVNPLNKRIINMIKSIQSISENQSYNQELQTIQNFPK